MSVRGLLSLGLRGSPAGSPGGAAEARILRELVRESVDALADAFDRGDGLSPALASALDTCRAATVDTTPVGELEARSHSCFDTSHRAAADLREREAEHREQVAALLMTAREAVATLRGGETDGDELNASAERVARLVTAEDLTEVRAQLRVEIERLRQLASEQRARWERHARAFDARVEVLKRQLEVTRREAEVDVLTNVASRRAFERELRERAARHAGFIVALVDVDDFKQVNDLYGHQEGDRVLTAVAGVLAASVRPGDVVGRLGGDEFGIIASGLTLANAERRLATVVAQVAATCRPRVPGAERVTISVGVAEWSAGDTFDGVQGRADAALYRAKRGGKHRVVAGAAPYIKDLLAATGDARDRRPAGREALARSAGR